MSGKIDRQFCVVCAWRENCAKKFCVPDGGAHCPDFTRDISLKDASVQHKNEKAIEAGQEGQ
jgi:hypothetical protein